MKKILFLLPLLMLGAFAFAVTVTPTPTPYPTEVWPRDPQGRQAQYVAGGTNRFPLKVQQVSGGSVVVPPSYDQMASISTSASLAANGATRTAAAQEAAPAGTSSDPLSMKVSATASSFISITLTSVAATTQYHQILAAPGAGLKYRILHADWTKSNGTTSTTATSWLTSLASNGVVLQGTYWPLWCPATVTSTFGADLMFSNSWYNTFLTCGYNEPLQWRVTAGYVGTGLVTVNIEYAIIQ